MSAQLAFPGVDSRIAEALAGVTLAPSNGAHATAFAALMGGTSVTVELEKNKARKVTALTPAIHGIAGGLERGVPQLIVVTAAGAAADDYGKFARLIAEPCGLKVVTPKTTTRGTIEADVVVGTVATLRELLTRGLVPPGRVRDVVIDGIDEMLGVSAFGSLREVLGFLPVGYRTVCLATKLDPRGRAAIAGLFPKSVVVDAEGRNVGGPRLGDEVKKTSDGPSYGDTFFKGYRFSNTDLLPTAFEEIEPRTPDLQLHLLDLLGFAATRRGLAEVYCRSTRVEDLAAARQWIDGNMDEQGLSDAAVGLGLPKLVPDGISEMNPARIFIRAIGALQADRRERQVIDYFVRNESVWIDPDARTADALGTGAVLYPATDHQIDVVLEPLPYFFGDRKRAQAAMSGYATTKGQVAPDLGLALRGEMALCVSTMDHLRVSRSSQRPDLLPAEFAACQHPAAFLATKGGVDLQKALAKAAKRPLDAREAITVAYALFGAIEADGGPGAVHKVLGNWNPFVARPMTQPA